MLRSLGIVAASAAFLLTALTCPDAALAQRRTQIRIVGSSTVYPFSSFVAEEFGKTTPYPAPVVESTGSGGGHKLFGSGVGAETPDITNSSRRMKVTEFARAQENGVDDVTEAVIGYDGIAIAQHRDNKPVDLTLEQITLAVVSRVPDPKGGGKLVDNPYRNWNEIDPSLPDREILFYGPPETSGTRDAFEELVLEVTTEDMEGYGGEAYTNVRTDGVYVPSGENDNLIVQRLGNDRDAFGIFGYSFLAENRNKIRGATINGVEPLPEAISSGKYPISRSLFFYVKNGHLGRVPGLRAFLELFMSEKMIGPDGFLKEIGLIPLPEAQRKAARQRVLERDRLHLKLSDLHDYMRENE